MSSSNFLKCAVFDSIFFTYTLALLAYALALVFILPENLTQEVAIHHFSDLCLALGATYFLVLIKCALSLKFHIGTLGTLLFLPNRPTRIALWPWHLGFAFLLTLAISIKMTEFSWQELSDPEGLKGALRLYQGMAHANLSLLPTAIVQVIETVFIAFLATILATPIAFVVSFLSAKNIMSSLATFTLYAALRTIFNVVRSVEPLIWALIFTVWVGVGPFAGMLALMVHSIASLAKQYSEVVEDVSEGPLDAIRATGANAIQVVWFGVVPQILLPYISLTIYRWDTNLRMATVIGLVGGGGIGTLLLRYQGQAQWPEVGCIIFVIAIAVWLMDLASAYIRQALR